MRRREFITLLGGAAATWSVAVRAQQAERMPVIGFLSVRSAADAAQVLAAFRIGLKESGFVEGQNVAIEFRWADGRYERLPALATDLVHRQVSVIAATGGEHSALAAKAATATIPIIFALGSDPVRLGLVASDSRPGGNATGVNILTPSLEPKRLGLLHELLPTVVTLGVLLDPNFPPVVGQLPEMQNAARAVGVQLRVLRATTDREIETAFATVVQERIAALAVAASPFFDTRRDKIIALAALHAVPAMYQFREYAVAGGLISYGIDLPDAYRRVGNYTGRVLKGEKPAELPVMLPTKFDLVINLKTAKALGLKIPSGVLSIADEAIE